MTLSRRSALLTGALLPLAAPALVGLRPAAAQDASAVPPLGPSRTIPLGAWRVSALLAGMGRMEDPQSTFGLDVDAETFRAVSEENFVPADRTVGFFTPTLVDTGAERILFDTGLEPGGLVAALEHAGYAPADVTHVVLTHMHPDHVGGLVGAAGEPTFPAATIVAGRTEFDFWAGQENEMFDTRVRPLADGITLIEPGDAVREGVEAVDAFGHTPGHLAFLLESEGERLMLTADTANHHVWSLGRPDWAVRFDMDREAAARTRRRLLGRIADERMAMLGYHLPFPAIGFVQRDGEDGFRWVPMTYQFL
ncbi:MBL fold metallo-hydrolase [Rubellimicrobium sp. CFH 75288]|uniref:MBL fold metallo-hydrolase n=1 Tax=Rubellimicrobium sp. CFH 75288 TaxID=2697034 RepID=UPI001411B4C5|nr:MBL fold metallo-hydrolase [Rubellimicrobium sp. CFH 75288]NAZ37888.1 MBL fold metallo-hydrolase [Rubellimicrobium sp. CFH 75288]